MKVRLMALGLAACGLACAASAPASAQNQYVGEVRLFGFNFCPASWLPANGQSLPISQYVVLFDLYGTTYGGDGKTTFNLPNLQGRAPVGATASEPVGAAYGASTVTLAQSQLPPVRPRLIGSHVTATEAAPIGALLGVAAPGKGGYAPAGSPANAPMSVDAISPLGSGQPVPTQSPSLAMTWCVAYLGVFPSRN